MDNKQTEKTPAEAADITEEVNNFPATEDYHTLFSQGVTFYEERNYANCAAIFKKIMELYPERAEALINYADANYHLGNVNEALKYWNLAKERDKYLINAYINMGNYYMSKNDTKKAISQFEQAFCINPYNEVNLLNLGIAYEKEDNRKQAFMIYEFYAAHSTNVSSVEYKNVHKKVSMHKLNAISHIKLGMFFEKKQYYRKALQSYYESIRVFPNFTKTYSNIGNILYKLEKYENAVDFWIESYKIDSHQVNLCLNLGLAYEKLEKPLEAFCFLTHFIQQSRRVNNDVILTRKKIAELQQVLTENPQLLEDYKFETTKLIEENKFKDAVFRLSNIFLITKDIEVQKQIQKLKPKAEIIYRAAETAYEIGKVLKAQGNPDVAIDKFKLSSVLWEGSPFKEDIDAQIADCRAILGDSISAMIKTKH